MRALVHLPPRRSSHSGLSPALLLFQGSVTANTPPISQTPFVLCLLTTYLSCLLILFSLPFFSFLFLPWLETVAKEWLLKLVFPYLFLISSYTRSASSYCYSPNLFASHLPTAEQCFHNTINYWSLLANILSRAADLLREEYCILLLGAHQFWAGMLPALGALLQEPPLLTSI